MEERVYCKLHVLHAYQPKGWKNEEEDKNTKGTTEELPEFLEKKIKSA
jgi:GcrA cell cycle regulator